MEVRAAAAAESAARLAYISPTPPQYLPYTSPISPLYLPYIAPRSPLYLPYISPISPLYLAESAARLAETAVVGAPVRQM